MSHKNKPDCTVPPSHLRCEGMTRPVVTYQEWRRRPHRCVRRAVQGRDGRAVCALHANRSRMVYWSGEPDEFQHKPFWRWPRKLERMLGLRI